MSSPRLGRDHLVDATWPRSATIRLAVAVGVCAVIACGRAPVALDTAADLLALFPFTDAGLAVEDVDLGSPEAERVVLEGWSPAAPWPDGSSVAWANARQSRMRLGILEPADGQLVLRCGLSDDAPLPGLPLEVSLNHRRVGVLRIGRGLREFVLPLPGRLQRRGANELALLNPLLSTRAREGLRARDRAVACDRIRVERGTAPTPHATSATAPDGTAELRVPGGTAVEYYLRVPANATLAFGLPGVDRAGLRVSVTGEGGTERTLFTGAPPMPAVRVGVDLPAGRLARVAFQATGAGVVRVSMPRLLGAPAPLAPPIPPPAAHHPNVILYVVDTLRADHLGCYGYRKPTSPALDALATEGMVFTDATAQASWTKPATASIHTGRYPSRHGAVTLLQPLRSDVPTLAETLRAAGYRTGGFVTNANVSGEFGFNRGFERYDYLPEEPTRAGVHVPADTVTATALDWLANGDARPFFLYLHMTDPHAPYAPPPAFRERFRDPSLHASLPDVPNPVAVVEKTPALATPDNVAALAALYDGEIAFTDASLGALMSALRERGLAERTIIVVTADHGEEFADHGGFEHGYTLYRELVHVPLVMRVPGVAPARIPGLVRQIDVMPTLLGYAGVPAVRGLDGRDLRPLIAGVAAPAPEAFAHTRLGTVEVSAIVTRDWKVIQYANPRPGEVEVYDRQRDPEERTNVADRSPILVGWARQRLLERSAGAAPAAPDATLRPELEERLRALGYLN